MAWNRFLLTASTAWSACPAPQRSLSSSPFKHTRWVFVSWDRDITREISPPALPEHRGTTTVHFPGLSFSTLYMYTLLIVFYAGSPWPAAQCSRHSSHSDWASVTAPNINTNPLGCLHSLNTAHELNYVCSALMTGYPPPLPLRKLKLDNPWVLHATAATELETTWGEVILIHKTG